MIFGRIIAWILVIVGLLLAGGELVSSLQAGEWAPQLLGQLWFEFDSESLNFTQAITQRYVHPFLWDPIIVAALLWPAWVVFLVPGLILLFLLRKRHNPYAPKQYLS